MAQLLLTPEPMVRYSTIRTLGLLGDAYGGGHLAFCR